MTKLRPARESRKPSHLAPIGRDSSTSGKSTVPSHPSASFVPSSTRTSTPASLVSAQDVKFMRSRIRQLEGQLSKASDKSAQSRILTSNSDSEKTTSFMSGTFGHDSSFFGQAHVISHYIIHKSRLFGRSHWSNAVTLVQV
jgi:hypothetical protein